MAAEMLADNGQAESGLDQLARVGFKTLGLQTSPDRWPQGGARLDYPPGLDCPHRLPA